MNTSGMGYKILDERYALLECLAVSGIGEIYRGRDLELAQTETTPSRILIHLLPSEYRVANLESSLEQARLLTQHLNQPWVLAIVAQGQTGDRQYFVLNSPESLGAHSVMSLPSQQLPTPNTLRQQFGNLVKTKQLPSTVDSAFLITVPNQSLYLLATAFIQPLHALRAHHTGLNLYQRPSLKRTLALSSIMVITLSTFAVEYRNIPDSASLAVLPPKLTAIPSPQALLAKADQAVLPDHSLVNSSALPLAFQEPLVILEPALVALSSTPIQTVDLQPLKPTRVSARATPKTSVAHSQAKPKKTSTPDQPASKVVIQPSKPSPLNRVQSQAAVTQASPAPPLVPQTLSNEALYYTASVEPTPEAAPKRTAALPTAPHLTIEDLIERANQALAAENFSAKNGVLFYARQIKLRNHLHPQVERLGRFVVIYQHETARNRLKANESVEAQDLLNASKNLIQELNLKSLNSAQQVLEHKSKQYH